MSESSAMSIPLKPDESPPPPRPTGDGFYRLNPMDLLLIVAIVASASGVLLFTEMGLNWGVASARTAAVYHAGQPIHELDLGRDQEWTTPDGSMTMEVRDGKLRVRESNCANHICEKTGWIGRPGEVIACVPNQIFMEIPREKGSDLDAIVQ